MKCCCANDQVVKTTLEKGHAAGYQKEAQVCETFCRMCLSNEY